MFGNKPFGGSAAAKKPTIRRETVLVPVKRPSSTTASTASTRPPATSSSSRLKPSQRPSGAKSSSAASAAQSRQPPSSSSSKKRTPVPAQRALAATRGVKRKASTPLSPAFSSDSEDDDHDGSSSLGASDSDVSRKRIKSSASSIESSGPKRDLVLDAAFKKPDQQDSADSGGGKLDFVHGADATSGPVEAKFKAPWNADSFETVELQYPSFAQRERFQLKWPKNESDDYKPMEDIIETVKQVVHFYFPDDLSEKYSNGENGFARKFSRAWVRQSIPDFIAVVEEFNSVVTELVENGTIQRELSTRRTLPLDTVRRILDQIYARTVSPKVETLRAYQNGSDNVYGELLTRFCSEIFTKTSLNHESVFVDLGSGVGNVVLQAALQTGAESWGIEMMKNPCELADLQAKEFPSRSRLWGIASGEVHLLRGDFTENPQIAEVLKRADVVLINNQAFTPALNDKLRDMFLDLKNGCQVVSLKPFVPEGHKMTARNMGSVVNTLIQRRFEYFSDSVSWTDQSGYYYIAVKDPGPYQRFVEGLSRR